MAVEIRTSLGTPTANSYVSIASANEYFDTRDNSERWLNIAKEATGTVTETDKKSALLIQATREIDKTFRFHGVKRNIGIRAQENFQELEFPRFQNEDADNNLFMPEEVRFATFEQAIWVLERPPVRKSQGETTVDLPRFSDLAFVYIRPWIKRTVTRIGNYPWQGSKF